MESFHTPKQQIQSILQVLHSELDSIAAQHTADLAANLTARTQDLDQREADLAAALEQLSTTAAVQAAWRQSRNYERNRLQRLISLQLQHLPPTSGTRTVLHTLSRMIEEDDA